MTHFIRALWLFLATFVTGVVAYAAGLLVYTALWWLNQALQRLVLLALLLLTLAACGPAPRLRDIPLEALDRIDYDAGVVWGET